MDKAKDMAADGMAPSAMQGWIECRTRRTSLMMPPSLHARIKAAAQDAGQSFNGWCCSALEAAVRDAERAHGPEAAPAAAPDAPAEAGKPAPDAPAEAGKTAPDAPAEAGKAAPAACAEGWTSPCAEPAPSEDAEDAPAGDASGRGGVGWLLRKLFGNGQDGGDAPAAQSR